MRLEEEIKQQEFRNPYQKVLINLIFTNNYVVDKMNKLFKEYKLTRQQYNVLRILRGQHPEPASINLIRDRMLDKMSDASRIVERLRVKKLVDRKPCKDDRRAVDIVINDKGLKVLASLDGKVDKFETSLSSLSLKEAEQLNDLLDKLRNNEQ